MASDLQALLGSDGLLTMGSFFFKLGSGLKVLDLKGYGGFV